MPTPQAQLRESAPAPKKRGATGAPRRKRLQFSRASDRELWHRPTLTGWTPQKVEDARVQADGGALIQLADLCETMFRDDRISGVLSTRNHGLLGLPIGFEGGAQRVRERLVGELGGASGEWWAMHDESELAKLLRWGLTLGVGVAQRIPLPRVVGTPQRYRIETWSPRWLNYYHFGANGSHWRMLTEQGQVSVVPGDGEWILFLPYGARRPWAEGLWNACAFPWLLKHFSLEDRGNYSEVLGSPVWVGKTGKGSTEKQRAKFLNQLRGLGKNGKLVLPDGWDLVLKEATGRSYEIYESQVTWADQAITIALAGQLVTTEGTSGFSSGNIHETIKQDLIRFDAERLSTALHQQSLEPWARINYGSHKAAPRPAWRTQKPEDIAELSDGISKVGDAIAKLDSALKPHGLRADVTKLLSRFNIPVIADVRPAAEAPAPAPAKPAGQGSATDAPS